MGQDSNPQCVVCKSEIRAGAKKCLACGSRQDWLRFFDIGNTSLSLVIAAISVAALATDNLIRLAGYFSDTEQAHFTIKVTSVSPSSISLFVDNDGPGKAIFSGTAMCDVWPARKKLELWIPSTEHPGTYFGMRYPKPEEVVGRYMYHYGSGDSSAVIEAGQTELLKLPLRTLRISSEKSPQKGEVKSICNILFSHENGEDDIAWQILDSGTVSFFSLDDKDVAVAIEEYGYSIEEIGKHPNSK